MKGTLTLSSEERRILSRLARSRTAPQAQGLRARVILARAEEPTDRAVARQLGVSAQLVGRWRTRFLAARLEGLAERPRSGRPQTLTAECGDRLARELLNRPPAPTAQWTTRSLAEATGLNQTAVSRLMRSLTPNGDRADRFAERDRELAGLLLAHSVRAVAITVAHPSTNAIDPSRNDTSSALAPLLAATDRLLRRSDQLVAARSDPSEARSELLAFLKRFADQNQRTGGETWVLVEAPGLVSDPAIAKWVREHRDLHVRMTDQDSQWVQELTAWLPPGRTAVAEEIHLLRDSLREWLTNPVAPFSWRSGTGHVSHVISDSSVPGSQIITRPRPDTLIPVGQVALGLGEGIAAGRFRPGDRIKEAPLAARLGLSREPVRDALRVLAAEGVVDMMPSRGTTIPVVTAERVLEVYAIRSALGGVILRRLATLDHQALRPVSSALIDVRRAARDGNPSLVADADLRFQDAMAEAAGLQQTSLLFRRLTMQLRMFISSIKVDYAHIPSRIERQDLTTFTAVRDQRGAEAAQMWAAKMDVAVRYMVSQLPAQAFDADLWLKISTPARAARGGTLI